MIFIKFLFIIITLLYGNLKLSDFVTNVTEIIFVFMYSITRKNIN